MHSILLAALLAAAGPGLGRSDFTSSCNRAANADLRRGVLAIHSFWYPRATAEMQAAEKADPKCAIAFALEAFSRIHAISEDDMEGARAALEHMPPAEKATPRERAWIEAIRTVVAGADPLARHNAIWKAFTPVHRDFPEDDDATAFLALGYVLRDPGEFVLGQNTQAAALAFEVLAHNPDHPGALHYAIHALDTPELAPLALPAARRYAKVAPEAFHAQHIPAHIFSRLGMWPEALERCEAAWKSSVEWVAKEKLPLAERDFHSLSWLPTIRLEMGQPHAAFKALADFRSAMHEGAPPIFPAGFNGTVGDLLQTSGDWKRIDELLEPAGPKPVVAGAGGPSCHGPPMAPGAPFTEIAVLQTAMAREQAAAAQGDLPGVERLIGEHQKVEPTIDAFMKTMIGNLDRVKRVRAAFDTAMRAQARGDLKAELAAQRQFAVDFDAMPPPEGADGGGGPHERAGDLLLQLNQPAEAAAEFEVAVRQHPGHGLSVLGAAHAAAANGDKPAACIFARKALELWAHAESDYAPLAEAKQVAAANCATVAAK